jgi:hypothetical protein
MEIRNAVFNGNHIVGGRKYITYVKYQIPNPMAAQSKP